jgi:NTP pyrophosphatase (non-canonical NTP hydrolase)
VVNDEYEPIVIDVSGLAERLGIGRKGYMPDALQRQCLATWRSASSSDLEEVLHATLGLVGEAGETADLIKKWAFKPGSDIGRADVMDELADVLYYVAVLAHLWEFTIDDMAAHLREKLADGHGWTE